MGTGKNQWHTPWPDEQVQLLTRLWKEGVLTAEIAEAINNTTHGPKRTRGAVIGKAYRQKLGPHPTEHSQSRVKKTRGNTVQRRVSTSASDTHLVQRKPFGSIASTTQTKPEKKRRWVKISDIPAKAPSRPQPIYTSSAFAAPGVSLDERRFLAKLYPKD